MYLNVMYINTIVEEEPPMELNAFARIGKGVISKAIGLQKNHKEIVVKGPDKINEIKSGCFSCPYYQDKMDKLALGYPDADLPCQKCSQIVMERTYSTIYVNDKNRYGYQPTLKSNAIKLLLIYHFLQPDPLGLIKNVRIKDLAETLGCTTQTIQNCNDALAEYGYCYIGNTGWDDGCINVLLPEYKNYHKTAKEGGRGYLTMSSSLFTNLLSINTLNPLRLTLKGLIEIDNQSDITTDTHVRTSYKKLRYFLPKYCNRNVIQKALERENPIFSITMDKNEVVYRLPSKLGQRHIRKDMEQQGVEAIKDYVNYLNDILTEPIQNMEYSIEDFHTILNTLSIIPTDTYKPIIIPADAYASLGSMCVQYSVSIVQSALVIVYNNYINRGRAIENFGALVRTTIRHLPFFKIAS